jgi:hypothetical protein
MLDLARDSLELPLDEVDLGPSRLPVEHAGADLDRVADGFLRFDLALEPVFDQLDERAVVDQEIIDMDAVVAKLDSAFVQLKCLGRFHVKGVEALTLRLTPDRTGYMQAAMLIATIILVCVLVFLVALLWPRLSRPVEHGASEPLGLGGRAAGKAPGGLGRWLRKPFSKGQRAIHKSGSSGREVHQKLRD